MGFPKDTSKRDWSWDKVENEPHIRLNDARMLRIRPAIGPLGTLFSLELITKTGVEVIQTRATNTKSYDRDTEWLQAYAEYVFAGQNYVDEP